MAVSPHHIPLVTDCFTVIVDPERAGTRIDRLLAAALPELSRTRLKTLILDHQLTIDGVTVSNPSTTVKSGWVLRLAAPPTPAATPEMQAQALPLSVVYEDDAVIVLDKAPGMVTHPAPGHRNGTLINGLLAHCRGQLAPAGGLDRPGVAHRLDKDVSGLLAFAKTDVALNALKAQFAARSVERMYVAVTRGVPARAAGEIRTHIGRSPADRKKMAVLQPPHGKPAVTRYTLSRRLNGAAVLCCQLETGRTHQIRVHLGHIGYPLVGDTVYGGAATAWRATTSAAAQAFLTHFGRIALHAATLGFRHPLSNAWLRFDSPVPPEIKALIEFLE